MPTKLASRLSLNFVPRSSALQEGYMLGVHVAPGIDSLRQSARGTNRCRIRLFPNDLHVLHRLLGDDGMWQLRRAAIAHEPEAQVVCCALCAAVRCHSEHTRPLAHASAPACLCVHDARLASASTSPVSATCDTHLRITLHIFHAVRRSHIG